MVVFLFIRLWGTVWCLFSREITIITVFTTTMCFLWHSTCAGSTIDVSASLVDSPVGLTALGAFKQDSWKVLNAANSYFGWGDVLQLYDVVCDYRRLVCVVGVETWEKGWVKFLVVGEEGGSMWSGDTHLYAPLAVVRLGSWDRFLHWLHSPWLGDTMPGYFAATAASLKRSDNHFSSWLVSASRVQGAGSMELVEEGFGPYKVGVTSLFKSMCYIPVLGFSGLVLGADVLCQTS